MFNANTTHFKPRLDKISRLSKGVHRVVKRIVKGHIELIKDVDVHHKKVITNHMNIKGKDGDV